MNLPEEIEKKLDKLVELCKQYKVSKLFLFGSASEGRFNPQTSDIDLIVEIEELPAVERGENLMQFWTAVENLFTRKVDLLTFQSITNPYLQKNIENSKVLIYDRAS